MNSQPGLERCLSFINCQLQPSTQPLLVRSSGEGYRTVTISRQAGSGAHSVAERLTGLLQARSPEGSCPWTVFDRNLVERVLDEHHLPGTLAKFMPEDRISEMADTMDELFGLHPPSWTLVRQTADTVLRLAELGNVILIGRGGHVVTRRLPYVFHVRLVGSLERRVEHIQQLNDLSRKKALDWVQREERGRRRFLKKYFNRDINDPLLYHLVINTDLISHEEAARIIADAVLKPTHASADRAVSAEAEAAML